MPQGSDEPSGATLGYLAPICVAVFFIFVWIEYRILFGTRNRFRAAGRPIDPESWPLGIPYATLTSTDLDSRFPLVKYSDWLTHRSDKAKEAAVDPLPSKAPASPSDSSHSFDPADKEACVGGDTGDDHDDVNIASSHGDSHMECAICMESFEDDDSIRSLTCNHIYHATCIDPWFTKRQARCPLCKKCYPPEPGSSVPTRPPAVLLRNQIFPRVI
ncbi:hypothetical protein BJX68DRAFT_260620 [Aspergillus pseudodeflectus]|uniref:RING-type E3 ubiquitin transferase n=1 Tax=Aspergillus pseudodeflectus TaxID=176178 RepID=A0ABR4LBA3_9EURO